MCRILCIKGTIIKKIIDVICFIFLLLKYIHHIPLEHVHVELFLLLLPRTNYRSLPALTAHPFHIHITLYSQDGNILIQFFFHPPPLYFTFSSLLFSPSFHICFYVLKVPQLMTRWQL